MSANATPEPITNITETLSETRGKVSLPAVIVRNAPAFFANTLMFEQGEEVLQMGGDALVEAIEAAGVYPTGTPEVVNTLLRKWIDADPTVPNAPLSQIYTFSFGQ